MPPAEHRRAIPLRSGRRAARRARPGTWRATCPPGRAGPQYGRWRYRRSRPAPGSGRCRAGRITPLFDGLKILGAALVGGAVALDQPRAFGDLERQARATASRRRAIMPSQRLDLRLFLDIAMHEAPQRPQLRQRPELQIAEHRCGRAHTCRHARLSIQPRFSENAMMRRASAGGSTWHISSMPGFRNSVTLIGFARSWRRAPVDALHARRIDLGLRDADQILERHAHSEMARGLAQQSAVTVELRVEVAARGARRSRNSRA